VWIIGQWRGRISRWSGNGRGCVRLRTANDGSFTCRQMAQLYDFPGNLNSSGQCIGIIGRAGAYSVEDLLGYFWNLALLTQNIWSVSISGAVARGRLIRLPISFIRLLTRGVSHITICWQRGARIRRIVDVEGAGLAAPCGGRLRGW
jgi:hypothetical protein